MAVARVEWGLGFMEAYWVLGAMKVAWDYWNGRGHRNSLWVQELTEYSGSSRHWG